LITTSIFLALHTFLLRANIIFSPKQLKRYIHNQDAIIYQNSRKKNNMASIRRSMMKHGLRIRHVRSIVTRTSYARSYMCYFHASKRVTILIIAKPLFEVFTYSLLHSFNHCAFWSGYLPHSIINFDLTEQNVKFYSKYNCLKNSFIKSFGLTMKSLSDTRRRRMHV
jgi:hypothetical protein